MGPTGHKIGDFGHPDRGRRSEGPRVWHDDDEDMRTAPSPMSSAAASTGTQVRETHTGIVILIGDRAYKMKKPVITDFLDFSTVQRREQACVREVELNRRISPEGYLGVSHLTDPEGGPGEPVVVMRRYPDTARLSALAVDGRASTADLDAIAAILADFHRHADRCPSIDEAGSIEAITKRWKGNLRELDEYAGTVIDAGDLAEVRRLALQFIAGREVLFAQRVADRRIVDGHADLLAGDIFCMPDGPVLLDCLEFDDALRHVDGLDDAAFLAMDLEFLGRGDLGGHFLDRYCELAGDDAPVSLRHFYIAYRAGVRAKVDCIRYTQGQQEAGQRAARHVAMARQHLQAAAVQLVLVGGGPGSGKTTLAHGIAEQIGAQVISTDDVRRQLVETGAMSGAKGMLDQGLYSAENVAAVYDAVLGRARLCLDGGYTVILDGTWRNPRQRLRAQRLATAAHAPMVEFECVAPLSTAQDRVAHRRNSTSDATVEIAAALAGDSGVLAPTPATSVAPTVRTDAVRVHRIDTRQSPGEAVAEAVEVCRQAVRAPTAGGGG